MRLSSLFLFVILLFSRALPAQDSSSSAAAPNAPSQAQAESTDTLTLHSTVRRVIVDVVVRDSNNKPVHGLKASDFIVAEDGHLQNILTFDAYNLDTPSIALPSNAPHPPPNNFMNIPPTPERGPLYVILYDLVNMETDDQIDARRQVLKFINSKPPGTRFAIFVRSDDLYLVQGFTEDKDRLYSVLDPQNPKSHVPRIFMMQRNHGLRDPVSMMNVLMQVTQFMEGSPGRKNLIWLAGTFPLALAPRKEDPREYEDAITAEVNEMTRAQVAVYPINVGGVPVNPPGLLTGARPNGGSINQTVPAGGALNAGGPGISSLSSPDAIGMIESIQAEGGFDSIYADYDVQRTIADSTGGRPFYSTNDVTAALAEATDIGGNYYSLAYSPSNQKDDGGRRSIQVRLAERGYHLDYRHFYFTGAYRPEGELARTQSSESQGTPTTATVERDKLQSNMKHGAPMLHDLLFSAHIHADGIPAKGTLEQMSSQATNPPASARTTKTSRSLPSIFRSYVIDYRVTAKSQAQTGKSPAYEFAAAAYDAESHLLNGVVNNATGEASSIEEPAKSGVFRVHQQLDVPVNAAWIRIGVRDTLTNRVGTLEVQLPLAPEPTIPR
jgi:VWFA-related protein